MRRPTANDAARRPPRSLTTPPRQRLLTTLRGPGWARTVLLRRVAAGMLALTALVVMLAPSDDGADAPVLVAVRDLAAGGPLRAADLAVRRWPPDLVPAGALRAVADADGRVPAGAVRAGEALTDLRLVGPETAVRAAGPEAAAVPLRPADPAVAALLVPGSVVDVVAPGDGPGRVSADGPGTTAGSARVIAERATVLSVLATGPSGPSGPSGPGRTDGGGPLVLVALPRDVAAEVAAASLSGELAVTLR